MKILILNIVFFTVSILLNYFVEPMRYIQNGGNLLPIITANCIIQIIIGIFFCALNTLVLKMPVVKSYLLLLGFEGIDIFIISVFLTKGMGFDFESQILIFIKIVMYYLFASLGFWISKLILK